MGKKQRGGYFGMLLGTLCAILENMLAGLIGAGKGTLKAGEKFLCCFIIHQIPLYPNLEISRFYQNKPRLNGVIQQIIYRL